MRTWNMPYLFIEAHFSSCALRLFDLAQTQSHIFLASIFDWGVTSCPSTVHRESEAPGDASKSEIGLANFEFLCQLGARPFREGPTPLLLNRRQTRPSREVSHFEFRAGTAED
jgi:hypothetical protein